MIITTKSKAEGKCSSPFSLTKVGFQDIINIDVMQHMQKEGQKNDKKVFCGFYSHMHTRNDSFRHGKCRRTLP